MLQRHLQTVLVSSPFSSKNTRTDFLSSFRTHARTCLPPDSICVPPHHPSSFPLPTVEAENLSHTLAAVTSPLLIRWVHKFLTNRPQAVRIGTVTSSTIITNTAGLCPQPLSLHPLYKWLHQPLTSHYILQVFRWHCHSRMAQWQ